MLKKALTALILLLACTLQVSAKMDQNITLVSGSADVLKEKSIASIEFDWDGAKWDRDKTLEEQWGNDYAQILAESEATFIAQFNKKSKGLTLDADKEDAQIHVVFKITGADKHFGVGLGFGWETLISAIVTFYRGDNVILVLKMKRFEGDKDTSADDSVARCFRDIASKMVKIK